MYFRSFEGNDMNIFFAFLTTRLYCDSLYGFFNLAAT